jgi:hypothetical protein
MAGPVSVDRAGVALATVIHNGGMETCSLRVVQNTTTNEKTTRLFSSSRVVSVRMGCRVTPALRSLC